jgi:hypothetical protein
MTADLLYKRIDELTKQSRLQAKRIRRLVRERDEARRQLDASQIKHFRDLLRPWKATYDVTELITSAAAPQNDDKEQKGTK